MNVAAAATGVNSAPPQALAFGYTMTVWQQGLEMGRRRQTSLQPQKAASP